VANLLTGREYVKWAVVSAVYQVAPVRITHYHFAVEKSVLVYAVANLSRKTQESGVQLVAARADVVNKDKLTGLAYLHLIGVARRGWDRGILRVGGHVALVEALRRRRDVEVSRLRELRLEVRVVNKVASKHSFGTSSTLTTTVVAGSSHHCGKRKRQSRWLIAGKLFRFGT